MNKIAVYPGSFDPITKGHMDIINRAVFLFDKVIIGVLNNSSKKYWFSLEERVEMIKKIIPTEYKNKIEVKGFRGLLIDFMRNNDASIIIRGLRAVSDYEYELQLALTNKKLADGDIDTIFLPASRETLYLSSSIVKELAMYGGRLEDFVDNAIIEIIKNKVRKVEEVNDEKSKNICSR